MEELKSVKIIDYRLEYEKEKELINQTYLKDTTFDNNKKQIIKKHIYFADRYFNILKNANDEKYRSESRITKYLFRDFKQNINNIIDFNDIQLLNDLLFCFDTYHKEKHKDFYYLTHFFRDFFKCYRDLKIFIDSGFDESNYQKEINSLNKKVTQLQKFSSHKIELDRLPQHPSDTLFLFCNSIKIEKKYLLELMNVIITSLNFRFKGEYKTKPHPSKIMREKRKKVDICLRDGRIITYDETTFFEMVSSHWN